MKVLTDSTYECTIFSKSFLQKICCHWSAWRMEPLTSSPVTPVADPFPTMSPWCTRQTGKTSLVETLNSPERKLTRIKQSFLYLKSMRNNFESVLCFCCIAVTIELTSFS